MIKIHNVSHHFGPKVVLRNIDLTIPTGELTAVMGPNGAGKSTLLSAIAGLILPSEGYVEVNGKRRRANEDDELAIRRQMAYLPASPWMSSYTTPRDWLYNYGRIYSVPGPRLLDHIDRLLDLFHLKEQGDTQISKCSTGQKKKVAICGVLVTDAPYLVLDEPFTGGLDPSAIKALERVLKHYAEQEDRTVVISSQIPELVEAVADRIAIINDQHLAAVGTMESLRSETGCAGSLADIFEKITGPETLAGVERYFQTGGAK